MYFDICRLRRGPQDVPASTGLLVLTLGAYVIVGYAVVAQVLPPGPAFASTVLDTALLTVFTAVLLQLAGYPNRTVQTLTALAGTGVVLGALALPLTLWATAAQNAPATGPALAELGRVALMIWSVLVTAHIYRHALSTQFAVGMLATLACLVLIVWSTSVLVPRAIPGAG